jgi:hypothetical protein
MENKFKMCDCLERFKEFFLETCPKWKGKDVKSISLPEGFNSTGAHMYYVPVYIDIGYQRPKESYLVMIHCPICGSKLDPDVEPVTLQ